MGSDYDFISYEDKIINTQPYDYSFSRGIGEEYFTLMQKYKDKIAQIDASSGEIYTYGTLQKKCISTAIAMRKLGISPGDITFIYNYNSPDTFVVFIAALLIGSVPACIRHDLPLEETKRLVSIISPKIIFVAPELLSLLEEVVKLISSQALIVVFGITDKYMRFSEFLDETSDQNNFHPHKAVNVKDTALILFTSGSTGLPKAACISHYRYLLIAREMRDYGYYENSTALFYSSLYNASTVALLTTSIFWGSKWIILNNFQAHALWGIIEKYKVTLLLLSVANCDDISRNPPPKNVSIESLRCIVSVGDVLHAHCVLKVREILPKTIICQAYGSTEAGSVTIFNLNCKEDLCLSFEHPDSCGRPRRGVQYKVIDVESKSILGFNLPGEICIKSDILMNGCYNAEPLSDILDENGWYRTGDIGYYDENFCFYLLDRMKNLVIFRRKRITLIHTERVILKHPAVKSAVAFALPHHEDGIHPAALVVLKEEMHGHTSEDDIINFVEQRVNDEYRLRGGLKFVEYLDYATTGKVQRNCNYLTERFLSI